MVEKELHLSEMQVSAYAGMHQSHHKAMDSLNRQYAQTLEAYFAQISQSTVNKQVADSLEASLSAITTRKARITLAHFVAFKAILSPEQAVKFQVLLPEVMHVMQPQRPNGPSRR
jgi:Spy/CpxP family protein refolding chaperone